ncbi:MAG TPA: hypothetical protein VII45_08710 [Solirubrobacterales bacterium]
MNDQPTSPGPSGESPEAPRQSPLQGSVATATARIQVIIEAAEKAAAGIIDDAEAQARNYLEESRVRADRIADQRAQEMSSLADALVERAEAVKRQSDELLHALDQAKLQVEEKFHAEGVAISSSSSEFQPEPVAPPLEPTPAIEEPSIEQAPVHHLKPVGQPPWESELPPSGPPPLSEPPPVVGSDPDPEPQPVDLGEWGAPTEQPILPQPPAEEPGGSLPPPPPGARLAGAPPSDGARLLATQMAVAGSSRSEIEGRLQNEFGIHDAGPMLDAILGRED